MKRTARRILLIFLALIFAASGARLAYQMFQYRAGETAYGQAEALANMPDLAMVPVSETAETPDPYAEALRDLDIDALRAVNSDVVGWITIPDTEISYPLVQGTDDQYYLKHTWNRSASAVGAIFLESESGSDLTDFNTIVYGHRMNNGSMFASLKYFKNQDYWQEHPSVYIFDGNDCYRYDIFAAYEVSTAGDTYRLGFSGDAAKQSYIDYCLGKSLIDTGVTPTVDARILTLSTCTGNGHANRWVVQACIN
jgi:sortase B